jgi:hypothetical protein
MRALAGHQGLWLFFVWPHNGHNKYRIAFWKTTVWELNIFVGCQETQSQTGAKGP